MNWFVKIDHELTINPHKNENDVKSICNHKGDGCYHRQNGPRLQFLLDESIIQQSVMFRRFTNC